MKTKNIVCIRKRKTLNKPEIPNEETLKSLNSPEFVFNSDDVSSFINAMLCEVGDTPEDVKEKKEFEGSLANNFVPMSLDHMPPLPDRKFTEIVERALNKQKENKESWMNNFAPEVKEEPVVPTPNPEEKEVSWIDSIPREEEPVDFWFDTDISFDEHDDFDDKLNKALDKTDFGYSSVPITSEEDGCVIGHVVAAVICSNGKLDIKISTDIPVKLLLDRYDILITTKDEYIFNTREYNTTGLEFKAVVNKTK